MLRQKPIWSPYRNNWGTASPVLHKAPLLLIIQILQEAIYLVCNKSFCFLFAFLCFSKQLESISFPRGETQCKLGNMYRHVPMSKDTCGKLCEMENKQTLSLSPDHVNHISVVEFTHDELRAAYLSPSLDPS